MEDKIVPELLSFLSINPFIAHNSASRVEMFASHIKQTLVLNNSEINKIQSGLEREYGKYTFKIEMPEDGVIVAIIPRYKIINSYNGLNENPETLVIYESAETRELGVLILPKYCTNHIYFGFAYTEREGMKQLKVNNYIRKGTVFLDSPSVTNDGYYKLGINANVAFLSLNAVAEDGFIVSESFLKKLTFKKYETRVVEFGNKKIPLNIYGDRDNYKIFPDIGEYIREDGLLMALRENEPEELNIVEKGIEDLMRIDRTFDSLTYCPVGLGKIVDIKIYHDINYRNQNTFNIEKQCEKYDNSRRDYLDQILKIYKNYLKLKGDALQISPELHNIISKECLIAANEAKDKLNKLYRSISLDVWRVEFIIEYVVKPTIGYKLTDMVGGKGVIVQILPDHEMPMDKDGNRADIVTHGASTVNRMNPGRKYEQYINSASSFVYKQICKKLNVTENIISDLNEIKKHLSKMDSSIIDDVYLYLFNFYKLCSVSIYNLYLENKIEESKIDYLSFIIKNGIYLHISVDDDLPNNEKVLSIENSIYRPVYDTVSFYKDGELQVTKDPCRIGSVYYLLLEKTGDDWSAVSSSKIQHHGVLSGVDKKDKYSKPAKEQGVRAAGDQETRIIGSYTLDDETLAELLDRNNNPNTHKVIVEGILRADKPTNIDVLVDRVKYPFGGSKPLQHAKHILECSGVELAYKKGTDNV